MPNPFLISCIRKGKNLFFKNQVFLSFPLSVSQPSPGWYLGGLGPIIREVTFPFGGGEEEVECHKQN